MLNEEEVKKRKNTFHSRRKEEKDKHFLMWTGVLFFIILIGSFWLFNMKAVFSGLNDSREAEAINLDELRDKFNSSFEELTERLSEIAEATDEISSSTKEDNQKESIVEYKNNLINSLEKVINSATTTENITEGDVLKNTEETSSSTVKE